MGSLPDVSFMVEGELGEHADGFAELEVVIETFDGQTKLRQDLAEALKSILEDDSWLDLNVLAELLDISAEQDMKMSFVGETPTVCVEVLSIPYFGADN